MKRFFLETNQIFQWINTEEQLEIAFAILLQEYYKLDRIMSIEELDERLEFGTRMEHTGDIKLLSFLEEQNIDTDNIIKNAKRLKKKFNKTELSDLFSDLDRKIRHSQRE